MTALLTCNNLLITSRTVVLRMLATLKSDREESQRECKWKNLYIFLLSSDLSERLSSLQPLFNLLEEQSLLS